MTQSFLYWLNNTKTGGVLTALFLIPLMGLLGGLTFVGTAKFALFLLTL